MMCCAGQVTCPLAGQLPEYAGSVFGAPVVRRCAINAVNQCSAGYVCQRNNNNPLGYRDICCAAGSAAAGLGVTGFFPNSCD